MKIVKILGGLGNQMFQYALFLALRERFPDDEVKVDLSCFRGYPLHNGYEVDGVFSLDSPKATWRDVARVAYPYPNYRCWQAGKYVLPRRRTMCVEASDFAIDPSVLSAEGDRYFDGYWQHEEYFAEYSDTIRNIFHFTNATDQRTIEVIDKVSATHSVSLHIRRGDYVNHPLFKGICTPDYYRKAIGVLQESVAPELYCIFSNDVAWCKENIDPLLPAEQRIYVDWNKGAQSYVDMQIMSHCKHNVIANSSFSWWGAWLNRNPEKFVVAPRQWMNADICDPIPDTWTRIQ